MLDIGQSAPDFTLHQTNTDTVSLSEQKGSNVILAFIPAAFTSVCESELCTFRDCISELNDADAKVFGISVDATFANAAFADKMRLNFPLLSDYGREAVKAYGIEHDDFAGMKGYTAAKRSVFIIDRDGTLKYKWVAPNPGVQPDYEEVKKAARELK